MAKKYHPKGPLINQIFNELKKDLNIRTAVVIGNCQAIPISSMIESKTKKIHIDDTIIAHAYIHNDLLYKILDNTDIIITQNISEKFHGINTSSLQYKYKEKIIKILNLYYTGFHADWCYFPLVNGIRLRGPMGDYHNKTIIKSFIEGANTHEALNRYLSPLYNEIYTDDPKKSLKILKEKEKSVDIKMVDFLYNEVDRIVCFHTFNHPKKYILNEEINRILNFIKIPITEFSLNGECLDHVSKRVNPAHPLSCNENARCIGYSHKIVNNSISWISPNTFLNDKEMVVLFYRVYRYNSQFIDAYRKHEKFI